MKAIKFGMIVCLAVTLFSMPMMAVNAAEKVYTIKFATSHPPMIPSGSIPQELEKVISEKTNGRVKFIAYLGSSLCGDYDAPQQLQAGAIEMCYGGYNMSAISPGWNAVAGMPFILDSYDHFLRFSETDAFKALISNMEDKGIKHVAHCGHPGFANAFNSVRAVKSLEDFKGLKMRIPPIPGLNKMCQRMGIQNVTVNMAEVSTALQTGVADGAFAPILKLKGYDLIRNAPHGTLCNASIVPLTFVANAKFWNSLPQDLQKILHDVFEEYGKKEKEQLRQMDDKFWEIFNSSPDTTFSEIKGDEKKRWQTMARPIWEEEKQKSEEARMVIDAIESTR